MLLDMSIESLEILSYSGVKEGSQITIPRLFPFLFSLMAWHLSEISQQSQRAERRERQRRERGKGGTNERRLIYSMARGGKHGFSSLGW